MEKDNGEIFWKKILIKAIGGNRISNIHEEYDMNPTIQAYFTNTKLKTKTVDDENKITVSNILKNVGFYDLIHKKV